MPAETKAFADKREVRPIDPVPGLSMEAAVCNAMARVVEPYDPAAAAGWRHRSVRRAEEAGGLASPGSRTPELLRLADDLVVAFKMGQDLAAYEASVRCLAREPGETVWRSAWRPAGDGESHTQASVLRFKDGFRCALQVAAGGSVGLPCHGPRSATLADARELAQRMEQHYHGHLVDAAAAATGVAVDPAEHPKDDTSSLCTAHFDQPF